MITRTPRSWAVEAYSATPRGSRWAESTFSSWEIPRSLELRERRVHRLEVGLGADEDADERAWLVELLEQLDRRGLCLRLSPATFTAFAAMSLPVARTGERDPLARGVRARRAPPRACLRLRSR